ncbi:hypothetical protein MKW94_013429 [Papaver nudicaule]|uniref:Kinetochore protein NDC80 n=1 Tax=Papaver nudicaule TaxID=74823 RepID=A0AA41S8P7_PAPNU|nr:hypothetical protein [Papaver nudicaule]
MKGRGRGGGNGKRPKKEPAPPLPPQPSISINTANHHRSSTSTGGRYHDINYQIHALQIINAYIASYQTAESPPTYLTVSPLPLFKHITVTLRFLFLRLGYANSTTPVNIEEHLPMLLDSLKCPHKIAKSSLKAPVTLHTWPSLCAVIHWLVECCLYDESIRSPNSSFPSIRSSRLNDYALTTYKYYMDGREDLVGQLETEKIERLRAQLSRRNALENEKTMLEDDVKKFNAIINGLTSELEAVENGIKEKEKELEVKCRDSRRIYEENEELRKTVDGQTVNIRAADRMKRELQAVERDIAEAEDAKNTLEEKSWELDSKISQNFKELVNLSAECNQAIKRIHSCGGLGVGYKNIKVALNALTDEIKRESVAKLEEQISLQQQQWSENAMKTEAKRILLAELQSKIDTLESHLSLMMKKETEELTLKCNMESKRLIEDIERETRNVEMMEKEAEEYVKMLNLKLEETKKQQEEEIQACARELLALVDSVSKYKEITVSTISEMKKGLSETAEAVETAFRGSLPFDIDTSSETR